MIRTNFKYYLLMAISAVSIEAGASRGTGFDWGADSGNQQKPIIIIDSEDVECGDYNDNSPQPMDLVSAEEAEGGDNNDNSRQFMDLVSAEDLETVEDPIIVEDQNPNTLLNSSENPQRLTINLQRGINAAKRSREKEKSCRKKAKRARRTKTYGKEGPSFTPTGRVREMVASESYREGPKDIVRKAKKTFKVAEKSNNPIIKIVKFKESGELFLKFFNHQKARITRQHEKLLVKSFFYSTLISRDYKIDDMKNSDKFIQDFIKSANFDKSKYNYSQLGAELYFAAAKHYKDDTKLRILFCHCSNNLYADYLDKTESIKYDDKKRFLAQSTEALGKLNLKCGDSSDNSEDKKQSYLEACKYFDKSIELMGDSASAKLLKKAGLAQYWSAYYCKERINESNNHLLKSAEYFNQARKKCVRISDYDLCTIAAFANGWTGENLLKKENMEGWNYLISSIKYCKDALKADTDDKKKYSIKKKNLPLFRRIAYYNLLIFHNLKKDNKSKNFYLDQTHFFTSAFKKHFPEGYNKYLQERKHFLLKLYTDLKENTDLKVNTEDSEKKEELDLDEDIKILKDAIKKDQKK